MEDKDSKGGNASMDNMEDKVSQDSNVSNASKDNLSNTENMDNVDNETSKNKLDNMEDKGKVRRFANFKELQDSRTKEERIAYARKAGIASGQARRKKKAARQEMLDLLETPIALSPEFAKALEESGLGFLLKEENATMQTALIASIFRGASIDGNPKLAELALALIGEKPNEKIEVQAEVKKSPLDEMTKELFKDDDSK